MTLDIAARIAIEGQCRDLVLKAAYYQDIGDFDALADLYAEDAVYHSLLGELRGRAEIRGKYGNGGGIISRHVTTNILFLDIQEHSAASVLYNIDLYKTGREGENPFVDAMFFELHDCFTRTDKGWLIQSRTPKMVFAPEGWLETARSLHDQAQKTI